MRRLPPEQQLHTFYHISDIVVLSSPVICALKEFICRMATLLVTCNSPLQISAEGCIAIVDVQAAPADLQNTLSKSGFQ